MAVISSDSNGETNGPNTKNFPGKMVVGTKKLTMFFPIRAKGKGPTFQGLDLLLNFRVGPQLK